MPNKTIYVSENDLPIFEQAQQIAGEALSPVIARALREYVARNQEREKGMKEVSVKVGPRKSEREQRFVASNLGRWKGLSQDKKWWLEASVFHTQKGNWVVFLEYKGPAMTNAQSWKDSAFLQDGRHSELVVANNPDEFKDKLPEILLDHVRSLAEREKSPVDYLDI